MNGSIFLDIILVFIELFIFWNLKLHIFIIYFYGRFIILKIYFNLKKIDKIYIYIQPHTFYYQYNKSLCIVNILITPNLLLRHINRHRISVNIKISSLVNSRIRSINLSNLMEIIVSWLNWSLDSKVSTLCWLPRRSAVRDSRSTFVFYIDWSLTWIRKV